MLVSTGDVRTWIGVKEADTNPNQKIQDLIYSIEGFVNDYTNRAVEARTYDGDQEFSYLDGKGNRWLYLPQYPISNISDLRIDSDREFGSASAVSADDFYFYPNGKVVIEAGNFTQGRRNIKATYVAGFAPVRGGTHNAAVSTYPCPRDLSQAIVEMVALSFNEGATLIHNITDENENTIRFQQVLSKYSFIKRVLDKYVRYDAGFEFLGE